MIKKILITGCGGMLGSGIYPYLKKMGYEVLATDLDLNEDWLSKLDVRDFEEAKRIVFDFKPDIILHLAALTSLEYCEEHLQEANETNYFGTLNMAKLAKRMDIPLVYISTAGVFDGKKDKYTEKDFPNPINIYGKTKLYGELALEHMLDKYFIFRAGWMIGGGRKDHKFVSYIISQAKNGNKEFTVVNDKFGTPTYVKDFAINMEKVINTENYGKYHMVCEGDADRIEITKVILDNLGISDYKIKSVDSSFFKRQFPVARPRSEILINDNLKSKNLNLMRNWKEALKDYLSGDWRSTYGSR